MDYFYKTFIKIYFLQPSKNAIAQVKVLPSSGLNLLSTYKKFMLKALVELEI